MYDCSSESIQVVFARNIWNTTWRQCCEDAVAELPEDVVIAKDACKSTDCSSIHCICSRVEFNQTWNYAIRIRSQINLTIRKQGRGHLCGRCRCQTLSCDNAYQSSTRNISNRTPWRNQSIVAFCFCCKLAHSHRRIQRCSHIRGDIHDASKTSLA